MIEHVDSVYGSGVPAGCAGGCVGGCVSYGFFVRYSVERVSV